MSGLQGFLFLLVLLLLIILIVVLRTVYDIWATSVTLKLLRNNQGTYSITRILIWVGVILTIAFILNMVKNRRKNK
jgi:hypothetical protein